MNENKEIVNIYLTDKVKDKILTGTSPYEKYIICINDKLQLENREYLKKIMKLESAVQDMEEELGQIEKRNFNIKGLLKNFHEMDKWRKEISENEEKMLSSTIKNIHSFKYRATRHLRVLEAILIFFTGIYFEYYPLSQFLPVLVMLVIITAFQESTLQNLQLPSCTEEEKIVKKLREEIKKTIKAQDYIHDFLDNQ